jgi:ADP-dependent NAD(P)H-hydrate dehydratase / NAD(P)H-hydrate epimerase
MMGGSYGKMGAIVLAVSACIRSGAGLVTAYVPRWGYAILQTAVPEAMTVTDQDEKILIQPPSELNKCNALGLGPGMGTDEATQKVVSFIIRRFKKPMVVDADGLNCMALQPELIAQLCRNTVITPHPKEFDRLFGPCENDFDRMQKARNEARKNGIIIILKGHHTLLAMPDGSAFFNATGNSGMAKGGSGDALTGIITALLAQGYPPEEAALLAVYLHGRAGDQAAEVHSREAMTASDLIGCLSKVFLEMNRL